MTNDGFTGHCKTHGGWFGAGCAACRRNREIFEQDAEMNALRARIAKLEAALEDTMCHLDHNPVGPCDVCERARAVLEQKP